MVCVETRPGADATLSAPDPSQVMGEDLHLVVEERGYDVLPFLRALAYVQKMDGAPPLGPHVTKIHSKTDAGWRRALCRATYVTPTEPYDFIAAQRCRAEFVPCLEDKNFRKWDELRRRGILRVGPRRCEFAAGTIFTARLGALSELVNAEKELLPLCTPACEMQHGSDGQIEHVLERYMGCLCTAGAGGARWIL